MLMSYWILPLIFIFHDFEEMIFVPIWKKQQADLMSQMKKPFFGRTRGGSSFDVGVLIIFTMLVIVSGISFITDNPNLYVAGLVAYGIHFWLHVKMCLQVHRYVPGIVTATLETPLMIWIVAQYVSLGKLNLIGFISYLIILCVVFFSTMSILHWKIMPKVQRRLHQPSLFK